ncbi:NTPase KAP family P-loop domain-containing protein 1-like [Hemicordylus capensis]|uniref:NTPase KAP family P-loop domain-containing protein 1-like n=1 Tax=Hemicordylus capensis TaxID=884348 RepID=UPI0023043C22|nr:NTPase KAP family P-loop domain-containing protein 1-like [Hemicordylus capensis]
MSVQRLADSLSNTSWSMAAVVSLSRGFQNKDEAYCFSLAKALYCVATPVTVGFYSPWGHCKSFLLRRIQEYMHLQSWKKDEQEFKRTGMKQRGTCGWDLVSLIFLMLFYRPVLTLQHRKRKNVRHVFIHFSAWEYAGSDQLWAGLITALCDGIESHFGLVPMSLYRAVGRKCGIVEVPFGKEWISKKYLCLPLWAAVLLVTAVAAGVAVLIFLFGIPVGNASGDAIAIVEGVGATAVGITAAAAIRVAVMVARNVVVTQKAQLERQMNRADLSAQLGFMSNVKREVKIIAKFLQFMEIFQRRKIRVVLEITSLDHCSPDKVVGVLDAMNILLSDYEAPFISILAVDPSVIVDCVESSLYMKGMANNGYEFLNRLITLPFSVPKMDSNTKKQLVKNIVDCRRELEKSLEDEERPGEGFQQANQAGPFPRCHGSAGQSTPSRTTDDAEVPLVVISPREEEPPKARCGKGFRAKELIQEALDFLLDESMKEYMTDNMVQMKRIINTISITVRLMATEVPREKLCPEKVTAWVLLANQWPCRLSWILQCIEDDEQMGRLGMCQGHQLPPGLFLWEVYEKYMGELDMIKGQLEKLLELDGDPELFHSFLCGRFRVEDANFFLPFTVNLDSSLKRQMELLRGSHTLKRTMKTRGLSKCTLMGMSVEAVCEEMNKLGLKEENIQRYKERLREHNLNGQTLVFSDKNEIKEALGMSLGEWMAFSMYFLGSMPLQGSFAPGPSPTLTHGEKKWFVLQDNVSRGSRLSLNVSKENL